MKRFKNLTLGILGATVFSLGLFACSNDNEATTENSTNDISSKDLTNSYYESGNEEALISYGNTMYAYENGFYRKHVDGNLDYEFIVSDLNYEILENGEGNITLINNSDVSEEIEILNFVENDNGIYIFDLKMRDTYLRNINLKFNDSPENISANYTTNSWWPVVEVLAPIVIEMIIDDKPKEDPNLVSCRKAMNSLNCGNGTNPYMNYNGGSWYSKSSCSVGCR